MKVLYLFSALAILLSGCSSGQMMSNTMEDDIYYVPGNKPLVIQEVETVTAQNANRTERSAAAPVYSGNTGNYIINSSKGTVEQVSTYDLTTRALSQLESADQINTVVYENKGYWIGGFIGSNRDMQEAARIIARYPEGFGYIANGQEIAMSLSLDSDWNVYTDNCRFWWFPASSNVEFYTQYIMGNYPRYMWTVAWNDIRFDSWAFDAHFGWPSARIGVSWGSPGWNIGFNWGYGYNSWYYDSWHGGWGWPYYHGYYSNWHHNHWYHDHYYPSHNYPGHNWHRPPARPIAHNRPGTGIRPGTVNRPGTAVRPGNTTRPGTATRPGTTTRP